MTQPTEPNKVGRRGFLVGLSALVASLVAAGAGYLNWGSADRPTQDPRAERDSAQNDEPTSLAQGGEGFFGSADPSDQSTLFALADVIVPQEGDAPAASEIDLLPRLDQWIQSAPGRRFIYSALWPELARAARSPSDKTKLLPQDQLETACADWYAEYRSRGSAASSAARAFEQLRRDVLRTYYASEAGHRVLGYTGPAMRMASPGLKTFSALMASPTLMASPSARL